MARVRLELSTQLVVGDCSAALQRFWFRFAFPLPFALQISTPVVGRPRTERLARCVCVREREGAGWAMYVVIGNSGGGLRMSRLTIVLDIPFDMERLGQRTGCKRQVRCRSWRQRGFYWREILEECSMTAIHTFVTTMVVPKELNYPKANVTFQVTET